MSFFTRSNFRRMLPALTRTVPLAAGIFYMQNKFPAYAEETISVDLPNIPRDQGCSIKDMFVDPHVPAEKKNPGDLPYIGLKEFQGEHPNGQVWVSWKGGVYNMSPFMEAHPGGSARIEMVNGQDLKAFWAVYKIHNRPHIQNLMEDFRIGNLTAEDRVIVEEQSAFGNYYIDQPERPRREELRIASYHPWNSEPPLEHLIENFYTPNDVFFVRNHNSVPEVDIEDYELVIHANPEIGLEGRTFTYEELKSLFPKREVISTLQCAGNRQEDFVTSDRPLYVAPHWRNGAIGCAKWGGVRVRDVLKFCGLDMDSIALGTLCMPRAKIVNFIGLDEDETGIPYAGVLPMEKVVDPFGDVILAYEMNGEVLPQDHGFPIRCLAPGHAGCRNVKWVGEIIVSAKPSELDSGSKLDRHFAPDVAFKKHIIPEELNLAQGPVIQTLPVQSIVCKPEMGQIYPGNTEFVEISGVAWSGAGRGICRVEVSIDGGKTFTATNILPPPTDDIKPECGMGRNWSWRQWTETVAVTKEMKEKLARNESVELEIVCRAIDGDFNSQPELMEEVWNVLGICVNHWSRVKITLNPLLTSDMPLPDPLPTPPPGQYQWKREYERVDL